MNLGFQPQPEQQQAVLQTDGPLLILAGAGSGKTRVIAHRIAYLVSEGFADPSGDSGGHLHQQGGRGDADARRGRCSASDCRKMWISTFHALCARLLRREAPHVGLSRDFVIYDSNDQLSVVEAGAEGAGHRRPAHRSRGWCSSRISHAKNRMEAPEVFASSLEPARDAASRRSSTRLH